MGQGGHSFICSRKGLRASLINHVYFPDRSVGKESARNAGTPGGILGQGRSPGEGKGYALQYSWASLVAQLVKNLPAMQETWVWSLGWEDSLEKGKATHSSIPAWRIPWLYSPSIAKSRTWLNDFHFTLGRDCFWANWLPSTEALSERVIASHWLTKAFPACRWEVLPWSMIWQLYPLSREIKYTQYPI